MAIYQGDSTRLANHGLAMNLHLFAFLLLIHLFFKYNYLLIQFWNIYFLCFLDSCDLDGYFTLRVNPVDCHESTLCA